LKRESKWPLSDSNGQPTDYAYHYGFRRLALEVCGLDYLFTLRVYRLVSTPSALNTRLGSGLPACLRNLGFPEFDRFYKRA